jgi:hypothetical protein
MGMIILQCPRQPTRNLCIIEKKMKSQCLSLLAETESLMGCDVDNDSSLNHQPSTFDLVLCFVLHASKAIFLLLRLATCDVKLENEAE